MAWKTVQTASIDLRDGKPREILIEKYAYEKLKGQKDKVHMYTGISKDEGPVNFIATDSLHECLSELGAVYRIAHGGKKELKNGRSFNIFGVTMWEGELPDWAAGDENPAIEKE